MNGITVTMAIVDFIPVLLFFIASYIILKDLYNKSLKGVYALMSAGSIMVFLAGLCKATWKILYALNICDFEALDRSFFPMNALGFMLFFCGMLGFFSSANRKAMAYSVVAPFTSNMPFVILQVLGYAGVQFSMVHIARKMKQNKAVICYILAFIFMLGMGYLSAKFDDSSNMHWMAQITNIISNGSFLLGSLMLHKAGLGNKKLW